MTPDTPDDVPLPIWRQLAGKLARDIASGRYAVGDRLPSLRQIRATEGVSDSTALSAIRHLTDLGLVEARHGSGVFVVQQPTGMSERMAEVERRLAEHDAAIAELRRQQP